MKKLVNLKKYEDKILFLSLGGVGKMGINVNLYHYQNQWIMIDCGIGFSYNETPGADVVISDLSFLEQYNIKLVALLLTHAHEDHIGAVQYLIDQLNCPIYAGPFTKMVIEDKLRDKKVKQKAKIIEMEKSFSIGPFNIENFALNHSIPEMNAIVIKTSYGNILHTGDWRFDKNPILGTNSDLDNLKYWKKKGILALISDSTNIFVKNDQLTEMDLRKNLLKNFQDVKGLLVLTTFASNIVRLKTFFDLAQQIGKKIVIIGKAIKKFYYLSYKSGYLKGTEELLVSPQNITKYPRSSMIVIASGSQGEPLGAMNKIINNVHPYIKLKNGDKVIFSSKIIPGNEKRIFNLINILASSEIESVTSNTDFVHVSGHASELDIKNLYKILKPDIAIPIHGESMHVRQHCKIAKESGVPEVFFVQSGDLILLEKSATKVIEKVHLGYYAVDGNYLVPSNSQIFQDRKSLYSNGILIITCKINKLKLISSQINAPGLLDLQNDSGLINEIQELINNFFKDNYDKKLTNKSIKTALEKLLYKFIAKEMEKLPIIITNLVD
ncbi:MAG: ribonuclease J [Rickettsia sp.]|nr:ribonuclease J [Rickettsia sp.]